MARNTEWVYFSGKGSWFNKLTTPDMEYGNWQIKLNFNDESYQKFMKLKEPLEDGTEGILNEIKQDEEGFFHVFKRPIKKEYKDRNNVTQTIFFEPPVVLDGTKGKDVEPQPWDKKVGIGNGSDITVKAEVYKYNKPFRKGKGRAIRLFSVLIENLIPYEQKDFNPEQKKAAEGLNEQPRQLF